jgi:drug/metabolite transporter (DMT)-like permease
LLLAVGVVFVLIAFAANSVLCRLALHQTQIDPASFTTLRILSGAITLFILIVLKRRAFSLAGSWSAALVLTFYAITFSYSYVGLSTGTGALLMFGVVQLTMIATGVYNGERIGLLAGVGWVLAAMGVVILVLPGVTAPPIGKALLMVCAGVGWGAYSLLGRGSKDPFADTAGNFIRALPAVLVMSAIAWRSRSLDFAGVEYAVLSGAIASGLGYVVWYAVLPRLRAIVAANLQLAVPVLAALAGALMVGEAITARLTIAGVLVIVGIALAVRRVRSA